MDSTHVCMLSLPRAQEQEPTIEVVPISRAVLQRTPESQSNEEEDRMPYRGFEKGRAVGGDRGEASWHSLSLHRSSKPFSNINPHPLRCQVLHKEKSG